MTESNGKKISKELIMIKRSICTLITIFMMNHGNAFAHTDFFIDNSFGNVKTSILTGFLYEEINKVSILGQLAEKLSKELNYSNPILLSFTHTYTRDDFSDFFISYDSIRYWDTNSESSLMVKGIIIQQFAKEFPVQPTLKLLEYAILNLEKIKSTQAEIEYPKGHYTKKVKTIDVRTIEKLLNASNSDLLNNVLKQRVDRPEQKRIDGSERNSIHEGISYYWQNNRYVVFLKYNHWYDHSNHKFVNENREVVLFDVENIYDFRRFKNWSAIIFDTDTSFYSVKQHVNTLFGSGQHILADNPKISQRQVIENTFKFWLPFQIESIGGDKVSIYFGGYGTVHVGQQIHRTLIYLADEDRLIQDLNELLKESDETVNNE